VPAIVVYGHRRFRSPYPRRGGSGALIGLALGAAVASGLGAKAAAASHGSRNHRVTTAAAPAPARVPGGAPSGNAALGAALAAAWGWGGGSQWTCLYGLWERESGWQNDIANPQSGAFGIAQALGHGISGTAAVITVRYPDGSAASGVTVNEYPSRAANSGDARAQINWGLGYIQGTYGTPCGAWAHEEADSWY
jgi:hypothetical protein